MIYAIQASSGPIKIGRSHEPKSRLGDIQTSSHEQLALLGACETTWDESVEAFLHKWFSPHRIRGEWFKSSPQVMEAVSAIRNGNVESFVTRRKAAIILCERRGDPVDLAILDSFRGCS